MVVMAARSLAEAYDAARANIEAKQPLEGVMRRVADEATARLRAEKDVLAACYLVEAATYLDGFPGLRDGLSLLSGLVANYWHGGPSGDGLSEEGQTNLLPPLEEEEPGDPPDAVARINRFSGLSVPEYVPRALLYAPLVSSRALGQLALREAMASEGHLTLPADQEPPTQEAMRAMLEAAAGDDPASCAQLASDIADCQALVPGLADAIAEKADVRPDVSGLERMLKHAARYVPQPVASDSVDASSNTSEEGPDMPAPGTKAVVAGAVVAGALNSRRDVGSRLRELVTWFDRNDPSSPVRELLIYSEQLLDMNFYDWHAELGGNSELFQKLKDLRAGPAEEGA